VFKHITPANLLFDPSCSLVKIADVGTVKDKHIILGYVSNELRYMKYIAPENFHMDSDHEDDCVLQHSDRYTKSDAWSLGLSLLELYNLTFPFDGNNKELLMIMLSCLNFEYGKSGVRETHVWPPRPPPDAPAQFRDFISPCLKLDETQRLGVDELLKHDFIMLGLGK
jgi:serine/threonine protein kinase